MTKIVVDINELARYSDSLTDNAEEFDTITKTMESIVVELKKGWTGIDSQKFINNATSYINNLKEVRNSLLESSEIIAEQVGKYNRRMEEFDSNVKMGEQNNG